MTAPSTQVLRKFDTISALRQTSRLDAVPFVVAGRALAVSSAVRLRPAQQREHFAALAWWVLIDGSRSPVRNQRNALALCKRIAERLDCSFRTTQGAQRGPLEFASCGSRAPTEAACDYFE
jgi:hypothetical protein